MFKKKLKKLGLQKRMRDDVIETFKIINGNFNYDIDFFNISPQTVNLLSRQNLKRSLLTN